MAVGRSRLARVIGPILIFLGALLITAAIAGPAYVAGKLTTIPLDIDTTTVAKSEKVADSPADAEFPAKSLDMCSINRGRAVVNEVSVTTQTRTLVTNPSDESAMTVQSGSSMVVPSIKTNGEPRHPELTGAVQDKRPCDDGLVQAWLDRVSLDRETGRPTGRTSEATYQPGESTPAVKLADRKGLQYRFPAGTTQDGNYEFFDLITRSNVGLKFVEEKEVSGTKTLHFQGQQDWVDLSTIRDSNDPTLGTVLTMPASWWGIGGVDPRDDITLNRWAKTAVDLWVDPTSGVIVDQSLHYTQQFRLPGQVAPNTPRPVRDFKLDVFDAKQRWTDATVRSQAEVAKSAQNKIAVAKYVAPVAGGILGVIALGLGIFALILGRKPATAGAGGRGRDGGSGDNAPTAPIDEDPITTPDAGGDPATEAFNAQPRPDESQTEAIDFRKRDER
ncbi:DUF3068 domain-containing protein [Tsukamurella asaccharolytica]|uniref:DUF3068 domain-containing protein n=1 Tax=Tsukamurella asaccharolytica TaxID=2592067 RepID=A0A5C5REW7_9ACTN|nr:DUF3068 domain-containing protein [Tsukamurella asaccharolytica]TWS21380.1 DUF3068 domain-containing protein [Tsukamurella asaccharolytica]